MPPEVISGTGGGNALRGYDDISGNTINDISGDTIDDISGDTIKDIDFTNSFVETKLNNIDVTNRELDTLLFAIGDSFGISEEGYLYAKESYIQNGLFKNFICENLTVTKNSVIAKNLTVNGNLTILGKLTVGKDLNVGRDISCEEIYLKKIKFTDKSTVLDSEGVRYSGSHYDYSDIGAGKNSSNPEIDLDNYGGGGGNNGIMDLDALG